MKRYIALLILISSSLLSLGNDIESFDLNKRKKLDLNRRDKYPAGFNVYIGGPVGTVAATFDYFITSKFSLEVGGGVRTFNDEYGFLFGGRYHFFGKTFTNMTPYIGVFSAFEYTGSDIRNYNLYIPFGIQRIKKNKFTWSIEAAYQNNSYEPEQKLYFGGKLGFRF